MGIYRYCFSCGTPTVLRPIEGRERDYCPRCERPLYENAKPCVGALIEDEAGRLLLVKRAIEPFYGYWDIPGGFLEADEPPEVGTVREVREETGLEVEVGEVAGIGFDTYAPNPQTRHHNVVVYYRVRPVGGALSVSDESSEARWFAKADLPQTEAIAFESAREIVARWRKI